MTRPSIVRADTIDLQDRAAPSAKNHPDHDLNKSRATHLSPHQAETLREVAAEAAEEEARSPRVSVQNGNGIDLQAYAEELSAGVSSKTTSGMNQDQEDALAIAQNGGISSSDEGDMDGDDGDLDDDMMDRISSSPSIDDEDIDFNFVYALHTFVATVEGQANATKGDTMALLDDSNSYWWLVRVIKDSSIGYLPAEHIETPTERLARLNKHRNVDLSASMLGDQAAKQKNSFKSIRKRRKTVTFADPTYVDYQDPDFSTDEEDIEELFGKQPMSAQQKIDQQREEEEQQRQKEEQQKSDADASQQSKGADAQSEPKKAQQTLADEERVEESAKVQPLKPRIKEPKTIESVKEETAEELLEDKQGKAKELEDAIDNELLAPRQTKNGTLRNTDSFFKDDTAEPKRITLTPNLLRDDDGPRASNDSFTKDLKSRTSLDKFEKELMSDKERKKKDKEKKDKEKKSGGLRGFFSRSSKKKTSEDDDDSGKRSMDTNSEPRESEDPMGADSASPEKPSTPRGKLQKPQPRTEPSPTRKPSIRTEGSQKPYALDYTRTNDVSNVPPASMRIVNPETKEVQEVPSNRPYPREQSLERAASAASRRDDKQAAYVPGVRSASAGPDSQPQRTYVGRSRMDLDDSDDVIDEKDEDQLYRENETTSASIPAPQRPAPVPAETEESQSRLTRPQLPGAFPDSYNTTGSDKTITLAPVSTNTNHLVDRLSESPIEVSPMSPTGPPALMGDTSSQEVPSPETSPSPELILADDSSKDSLSMESSKEPSWDDSKLRQFFDEGDHIRDLLLVVYDKTDAVPAKDHPVVGGLFREQNAKLAEITTQLDNMLGDWLARKQRLRGTV
ncbi:hypothetical protein B0I35DRAFT_103452 [Stachybotrys elegans]|uniref:SH3 domain-containing protein n=1 Tax=Stachybotrys elegans TaxID=80388 RepID=A0A8K0WML5_9HYPO|nr:hypothetical protein B0I35DRAFT_103452 [Stachybotrys elegans]